MKTHSKGLTRDRQVRAKESKVEIHTQSLTLS